MKKVVTTSKTDFIAEINKSAVKDAEGKNIWVDEPNRIGKCKNSVRRFSFFEPVHEGDDTTYTKVTIYADVITALAEFIKSENAIESEEFLD